MHSIITNAKKIVSIALCLILLIIGTNLGITKAENSQTDNSQTDNSQTDNSQTDNSQTDNSQTDNSQTDNSQTGYKLIVSGYEVTDNSISESNYFSYTTNGTDWTEITDNGTYKNVLAIKLTLDQNYSLANYTSICSVGVGNNNNVTTLDMSEIMTNLMANNGFTLTGDNIDRFEINNINFNQTSDQHNNDEPNNHFSFNGTIYLVWQADNQIYYHKFVLPIDKPTQENKFNISTVTADNDNNVTFKIGNPYEFCYQEIEGLINAQNLKGTGQLEWLREHGYTIDPCGANCTSNSIATNGDRAFRLTIYNNNYQSFTLETDGTTTYKTNADDAILTNNNMDLSDTTANKPAEMNAFLLNDTITITPESLAENLGSTRTISSINALNVPNTDAIVINNSGEIQFKSNYYNNVTFKIVTNDNKEYFVKINRYNTLISDSLVPNVSDKIFANIYYDTTLDPKDLEVRVKVVYKNGSTEIKNANLSSKTYLPNGEEEDGTSTTKYCTNLKMSTFYISSSNVADAYFTVINTSNNTILSGSGYGLHYSVAQRKTIY